MYDFKSIITIILLLLNYHNIFYYKMKLTNKIKKNKPMKDYNLLLLELF